MTELTDIRQNTIRHVSNYNNLITHFMHASISEKERHLNLLYQLYSFYLSI